MAQLNIGQIITESLQDKPVVNNIKHMQKLEHVEESVGITPGDFSKTSFGKQDDWFVEKALANGYGALGKTNSEYLYEK